MEAIMSTVFSRIPQPMNGMNWEPTPSDYTSLPAPSQYGDTDFANADFAALWGADGSGVGRKDLSTLVSMGVNTVKMYNWSVPAPTGYWQRDHTPFLAQAKTLGLSVIIPISNFFTGTAYSNRTSGGNPGGPPASAELQSWITAIVAEVYGSNLTPGPAIMWAIGNEYDNSNVGAYGYCEAQDIATIAQYIVNAETSLGISSDNVLAFTSPVTTALTPINSSIGCSAPYNTLMGGCATQAVLTALGPTLSARFIASINSYQIGQQLVDYYQAFGTVFPNLSFFYGELGWSEANGGASAQAQKVYNQFTTTIPQASPGSYYYGACAFEFSDELWKGPAGSSETTFGIYTFPSTAPTVFSHEGNHAPVWGARYPVDAFVARPVVACLQAALTGTAAPGGCGSSSQAAAGTEVAGLMVEEPPLP
jgi:hypothetical protein